jgi:hypothetical protein
MSQNSSDDLEDDKFIEESYSSRPLDAIWGKKSDNEFLYNHMWSNNLKKFNF